MKPYFRILRTTTTHQPSEPTIATYLNQHEEKASKPNHSNAVLNTVPMDLVLFSSTSPIIYHIDKLPEKDTDEVSPFTDGVNDPESATATK